MTLFYLLRFSPYNLLLPLNCLLQQPAIKLIEPRPAEMEGRECHFKHYSSAPPGYILLSKTFIVGQY